MEKGEYEISQLYRTTDTYLRIRLALELSEAGFHIVKPRILFKDCIVPDEYMPGIQYGIYMFSEFSDIWNIDSVVISKFNYHEFSTRNLAVSYVVCKCAADYIGVSVDKHIFYNRETRLVSYNIFGRKG